jgi:hypothetical protein
LHFWNTACSLDDANDPSTKHLEMLEGSFVWEARSLYIVAVGAPMFVFYPPVGLVIVGLGLLVVVVMVRASMHLIGSLYHVCIYHVPRAQDTSIVTHTTPFCAHASPSLAQDTTFSCVVTALFLRPIFKILGEVGGVRSPGQISLEKTKWLACAPGIKSGRYFFDGIVHQCWAVRSAGRLRKTVLYQSLLELHGLWAQPGLRAERRWHALDLRGNQEGYMQNNYYAIFDPGFDGFRPQNQN